jgi:hypothetical protein
MPIPGVPRGLLRQVRDAFLNALRSDPKLANKRVIKHWIAWDGATSVAEPTVDQMPAAEVMILSGPAGRLAGSRLPGRPMKHVDECRLTAIINLWTPGTDEGDLGDVADLIRAALAPQDDDARAELQERFRRAGIKDWQQTRPILPSSAEGFSLASIAGQGSYELTVQYYA